MSFTYIDTHVHFWDPARLHYPWHVEVPSIAMAHTPVELRAETAGVTLQKIVFAQCEADRDRWLDEVKWIEQLAVTEPRIAAIIAHAPMNAGAATTAAIAELKQHPLVRSVRHLIQGESDPEFCLRPAFVTGVKQLGPAGFTFDLCCVHPQLPSLVELVRRCPEINFILDHAGKPGIRARLLDPWREHMAQLAALPNVTGKISGLVTEADQANWTVEDLRPYVAHLLAVFGPARLMFGSDWPVVKIGCGYLRWLETVRGFVSHLSPAEQTAIFQGNATRVYRLA